MIYNKASEQGIEMDNVRRLCEFLDARHVVRPVGLSKFQAPRKIVAAGACVMMTASAAATTFIASSNISLSVSIAAIACFGTWALNIILGGMKDSLEFETMQKQRLVLASDILSDAVTSRRYQKPLYWLDKDKLLKAFGRHPELAQMCARWASRQNGMLGEMDFKAVVAGLHLIESKDGPIVPPMKEEDFERLVQSFTQSETLHANTPQPAQQTISSRRL